MTSTPLHRERLRLLVVGVGGQGALTAARMIGEAAFSAGLEVVIGQLHGMSQRGGSVRATVLIGPGRGSFIGRGEADVVLGLEPLETLRARPEMSEATKVVVNMSGVVVVPNLCRSGIEYPELAGILAGIRSAAREVVEVDGSAIVEAIGAPQALNIAMLGAIASLGVLPFDDEMLWSTIEQRSRAAHLEANRLAFWLGREAVIG